MGHKVSSLSYQDSATDSYPQLDEFNSQPHVLVLKDRF